MAYASKGAVPDFVFVCGLDCQITLLIALKINSTRRVRNENN